MLGLVRILVDFIAPCALANFSVVLTHPGVQDDGKGAWEREAMVIRKLIKVPTNQGSAHDGQGTGRVTREMYALLLALGSRV